jgi:hypothetical protein
MWQFFKPKHTLRSVARQLAEGLEDGTILLRPKISASGPGAKEATHDQFGKCPICGGTGQTSYDNGNGSHCPHEPKSEWEESSNRCPTCDGTGSID